MLRELHKQRAGVTSPLKSQQGAVSKKSGAGRKGSATWGGSYLIVAPRPSWVPDKNATDCYLCAASFSIMNRRVTNLPIFPINRIAENPVLMMNSPQCNVVVCCCGVCSPFPRGLISKSITAVNVEVRQHSPLPVLSSSPPISLTTLFPQMSFVGSAHDLGRVCQRWATQPPISFGCVSPATRSPSPTPSLPYGSSLSRG